MSIGILVGGPLEGARIDIDPRIHSWAVLDGEWYRRKVSNKEMDTAKFSAELKRGMVVEYHHRVSSRAKA